MPNINIQLDESVKPGDDFFAYVNNSYIKSNPIPDDEPTWGPFHILRKKTLSDCKELIDSICASQKKTKEEIQLCKYYNLILNKDKQSEESVKAIIKLQKQISGTSNQDLSSLLGYLSAIGAPSIFEFYVGNDDKKGRAHALFMVQSGTSLPNRDYYLDQSSGMKKIRKSYLSFIDKYNQELEVLGIKANISSDKILEIETYFANSQVSQADTRNPSKYYNKYSYSDLVSKYKQLKWDAFFEAMEVDKPAELVVCQESFIVDSLNAFEKFGYSDMLNFLSWQAALAFGGDISEKISVLRFDFFGKQLMGAEKQKPLWIRAVEACNSSFPDVIGKHYVAKYFPESSRERLLEMASNISKSFDQRIKKVEWLGEDNKKYAAAKLRKILVNVGHSEEWDTNPSLRLNSDNLVECDIDIEKFITKKLFKTIGHKQNPRNFSEGSYAQMVNAWTDPSQLTTTYPAAVLQWPFFDPNQSDALNYGSIGSFIGHELTHNFDNNGTKYDINGELNNWIKDEEIEKFARKGLAIAKLADEFEVAPAVTMNGEQVLGELIADLGGLEIVLEHFKSTTRDKSKLKQILRQVFIAYALSHASSSRPEYSIMLAKSDEHPNDKFRVNGVLQHCDDFYEVFDVKETEKLYLPPEQRANIW